MRIQSLFTQSQKKTEQNKKGYEYVHICLILIISSEQHKLGLERWLIYLKIFAAQA